MLKKHLSNIPTNLIMGFLGVGKTTAILNLLSQKPEDENWAVLVNEFGQIGVDGAIFKTTGATVREIPGGCLCCAVGLPFQVAINRLVKEVKPDRLLIEPSGIGHPKKIIEMLTSGPFQELLDLRANLCLVDPQKFKESRYTSHETFIDQIALSDVLIANKIDQADQTSLTLFQQWAEQSNPAKTIVAQTSHGHLKINWLDQKRCKEREAIYPNSHSIKTIFEENNQKPRSTNNDKFYSYGIIFPTQSCFDYDALKSGLQQLQAERIKGLFKTNKGWFIVNSTHDSFEMKSCLASDDSRIEIISQQGIKEIQLDYFNNYMLG